jgi:hypothetical protein
VEHAAGSRVYKVVLTNLANCDIESLFYWLETLPKKHRDPDVPLEKVIVTVVGPYGESV